MGGGGGGVGAARQHQRLGTVGTRDEADFQPDIELEVAPLEAPSLYEVKGHVYIREIQFIVVCEGRVEVCHVYTFIHVGIRRHDMYMHMYILS